MTAQLRDERRDVACAVLRQVGPNAPTLCEGWSAYDLAVHLWTLNHSLIQAPADTLGMKNTARRLMERTKEQWPYEELVSQLESGPASFRWMPCDFREDYRHSLGEWYIHGEDARRANGIPVEQLGEKTQSALWERLKVSAKAVRRKQVIAFRTLDGDSSSIGKTASSGSKGRGVVVTGLPSELFLWAYGREAVANVEVAGGTTI
ncbi:MAG: maleylpyruvate isomerase family mycothiol-dependent enzyme [Flaviflexus sp.]|uniref:maleylpyruvate isomerase family mycothiol-dependent enzyme n=1 Tax=Flaviflexus sp. TaxID=1969482 RepID=UPI003F92B734